MTQQQKTLTFHAIGMIVVLLVAVPVLTSVIGGPVGYLASISLYWIGFCLPVIFIHLRDAPRALFSPAVARRNLWVFALLGVQLAALFYAGLWPHLGTIGAGAAALGVAMAVINGLLEEAAWRGGFLKVFGDRPRLGFWLGLALFTAWHIPLALAQGIVYEGGALALVGGAAGMGLVWSVVAWRTGSIFWPALTHALVNAMVFPVLVGTNGFV